MQETNSENVSPLFERVAILGVGLIGGSIALGLKVRGLAREVVGYSPLDGEEAFRLGLVDRLAAHAALAVEGADLVVVAVPPTEVAKVIALAMPGLNGLAIVTDVSSVKAPVLPEVAKVMGERFRQFVSSHPIAGAEHSGPAAANAMLFTKKQVVIDPSANPALVDKVVRFWSGLEAEVSFMPPSQHDAIYAAVSHLPHMAAFALCLSLSERDDAFELLANGGAGLRDTSRVGGSSATLWTDILLANREALAPCAEQFALAWSAIAQAVQANDKAALQALLEKAGAWRRALK